MSNITNTQAITTTTTTQAITLAFPSSTVMSIAGSIRRAVRADVADTGGADQLCVIALRRILGKQAGAFFGAQAPKSALTDLQGLTEGERLAARACRAAWAVVAQAQEIARDASRAVR